MRTSTELCQSMVIDHCKQSTFHNDGFSKWKFREQCNFRLHNNNNLILLLRINPCIEKGSNAHYNEFNNILKLPKSEKYSRNS